MPRAKVFHGGSWIDTDLAGAVDFGGNRLAFGPPTGGGTIDEFLTLPNPLSQSNWADVGANVATRFAVSVPGEWIGIRFWRSEFVQNPGNEYVFGANQGTGVLLTANTGIVSGTRDAFVSQDFAAPVDVVPGVDYVAAYHTDRYGFSRYIDGAAPPFTSPSGQLFTDPEPTAIAFYTYTPNTSPGSSAPNFHFNISPIVRFPA